MSCYKTLRPAIFAVPPEGAHRGAVRALRMGFGPRSGFVNPALHMSVAGLEFANPVGLAAGFDKNAECVAGVLAAGFGFAEVGTVTPRAQPGNPKPRVFRLVEQEALINRLGFNNEGAEAAAARLSAWRATGGRGIVGGNIGKNKESADAVADYVRAMRVVYPHVDYITANISSPNTPGLRALQAADELRALVRALQAVREEIGQSEASAPPSPLGGEGWGEGVLHGRKAEVGPLIPSFSPEGRRRAEAKPIFVKIAPDGDAAMFEAIAEVALSEKLDGLIVSNTTIARDRVSGSALAGEAGGLSGRPLFEASTAALATMYRLTGGKVPLIGVGGISSAEDAYAKIRAGANLVQLYTALVYQGFGLAEWVNRGLVELLARDGVTRLADAVGVEAAKFNR